MGSSTDRYEWFGLCVGFLGGLGLSLFNLIYPSLLLSGQIPTKPLLAGVATIIPFNVITFFLGIFYMDNMLDIRPFRHGYKVLYVCIVMWAIVLLIMAATFGTALQTRGEWEVTDWSVIDEITAIFNRPRNQKRKASGAALAAAAVASNSNSSGMRVDRVLVKLARTPDAYVGCLVGIVAWLVLLGLLLINQKMGRRAAGLEKRNRTGEPAKA